MEEKDVSKLKISKLEKKNDTIARTIRVSGKTFDKIEELAEKNKTSFNNVVNQIIEFGLENLDEEK
jgi:predicted DNA-binding ribbon-helix-helix protein